MPAVVRAAAGLVLVLAATACTDRGTERSDPVVATEAAPSASASEPSEPSRTPSQTPSTLAVPDRCAVDDRDVMAAAVDDQLAAITAGQWADALGFTSSTFRAQIDEAAFERLIVDQFPVVAAAVGADATSCLLAPTGDVATLSVTVEDGDGSQQDLAYLFEREDGSWLIGGAVERDQSDDPTITI